MLMISLFTASAARDKLRRLCAREDGFAMIVAMGVMMVTAMLIGAAFIAVQGDSHQTAHDLSDKRAYYAAQAAVNQFLFQLNQSPDTYWQSCPTVSTPTQVPGSTAETYTYKPVPANGATACSVTSPVATMIDTPTGTFSMEFTGSAGTPAVTRTLVVSFRRKSPLDYLWWDKYETLDPNTYSDPATYADCAAYHRTPRPTHCTEINWVTGDVVNGPLYTEDQLRICGSPTFGRPGKNDPIQTLATSMDYASPDSGCGTYNPKYNTTPTAPANPVPIPSQNTDLLSYAQSNGAVFYGATKISLSGNTATVINNGSTTTVPLASKPIIYVANNNCTGSYSPYAVDYNVNDASVAGCGDAFVSGSTTTPYTTSLTIAAQNDIIITGSVVTTHDATGKPTGGAVLGLVANNFVRVEHGITGTNPGNGSKCTATDDPSSTLTSPGPTIDAAIMALSHSFIVDNYNCGSALGTLTVNGAIAQQFRGTVGTSSSSGGVATGYLKNYNYDDRFKIEEPPYVLDLAHSTWGTTRETLCGGTGSTAC
jgi:hypothetical protein